MSAASGPQRTIYPVILSGGSGTRLWPLSRALYPKQLQSLVSVRTMLQETAARVHGDGFAAPMVVCNEEHRFLVAEQLRAAGITASEIVLEPAGRNTAPAATVAALILAGGDPDAVMLLLPSDHVIEDVEAFHEVLGVAAEAAAGGSLVTFGIPATAPETGYGYIHRGEQIADGCFAVAGFVEKPDLEAAQGYVEAGGYDWNSGMFMFPVSVLLDEVARLKPDMLAGCRKAVDGGVHDLDFLRLDAAPFLALDSISVDYAVMEHTARAAVVPAAIGWNDVGSWAALWAIGEKDAAGNVVSGDAIVQGSSNCYVRAEGNLAAVVGVEDLVIVAVDDAVMVASRDNAQDVGEIVKRLEAEGRTEHALHPLVYRPWGSYQQIDAGERFQVKQIIVKPGEKLSLQKHRHRAEHWIVVAGTARVTRGEKTFDLAEDQSTYIPIGTVHALENPGETPLRLIEVQSGSYLGEDDIERLEDRYGRAEKN